MTSIVKIYKLLFADDLKIYFVATNIYDNNSSQEVSFRFQECCNKNCIQLNVSKYFHIRFTRREIL